MAKIKSAVRDSSGEIVELVNCGEITYAPESNLACIWVPRIKKHFFVHNVSASSVARLFRLASNREFTTRVYNEQVGITRKWYFEV